MKDNILKVSCRFNVDIAEHREVYDVLRTLDPKVCKSKSQFLINAAHYYISQVGADKFAKPTEKESAYVTQDQISGLAEEVKEAAVTEARNEVIRLLGGMICGARAVAPLTDSGIYAGANSGTNIEESKEETEDDTLAGLATQWMD